MHWSLFSACIFLGVVPAGITFFLVAQTMAYRGEALAIEEARAVRMLGDRENIDAFLEQHPRNVKIYKAWCQAAIDEGFDTPEAKRRLAVFRRRFPKNEAGLFWQALGLRLHGDLVQAEAFVAASLRPRPHADSLALYLEYALLAELRQDWPAALQRWGRVQAVFPQRADGFLGEAAVASRYGDDEAADRLIQHALLCEPTLDRAMVAFAEVAERLGRWTIAADRWASYRLAFELRPEGYLRGMNACYRAGRTDAAKRLLAQIDVLFLTNPAALAERDKLLAMAQAA